MNKKLLLIIIPLVLVGVIGFRLAVKNNESSNAVQKVAVDTKNLHHLAMKIDDMYCASCPYNVENALKDTPGVVVEGRGEVVYDTTKTTPDKIQKQKSAEGLPSEARRWRGFLGAYDLV